MFQGMPTVLRIINNNNTHNKNLKNSKICFCTVFILVDEEIYEEKYGEDLFQIDVEEYCDTYTV